MLDAIYFNILSPNSAGDIGMIKRLFRLAKESVFALVTAFTLSMIEVTTSSSLLHFCYGMPIAQSVGMVVPISYPFFLAQWLLFGYLIHKRNERKKNEVAVLLSKKIT